MGEPARKADNVVPLWRARAAHGLRRKRVHQLDAVRSVPFGPELFKFYAKAQRMEPEYRAYLGLVDRYYLAVFLLHRTDFLTHGPKGNKWLYERCREVEAAPDGHLDLWARDHYKSSLITQTGAIQEILRDSEITIGIFSHTKPIAKGFLWAIKREIESNDELKTLYPEVLYWSPKKDAPRWSEDGIVVKRRMNPKECTVEAHGLVDGQPTSKHFRLLIFDDVWTRENVTTPEQITKTIEARELSENLGQRGGSQWNIGTRYSFADGYASMIDREVLVPRIYPATHDGTLTGTPIFLTDTEWDAKKKAQPTQISAQFLQNPLAGRDQSFQADWLKSYMVRPRTLNIYILCDPSKGTPNRRSDRTAIAVIGIDAGGNKYLLDGYRHRMKLPERWKCLKTLHKKWTREPGVQSVNVGYERYGMQTDIEYFEEQMEREKLHFTIEEVNWTRDHNQSKQDRVDRLVPDVKFSRFYLSAVVWNSNQTCLWKSEDDRVVYRELRGTSEEWTSMEARGEASRNASPIKRVDEDGKVYDLTAAMIEEMLYFPFGSHDDLVDAASRIYDMEPVAPRVTDADALEPETYMDT